MTEKTWITDEFENKTWTHQGWTLKVWSCYGGLDIEGPGNVDVWLDEKSGTLDIKNEDSGTGWHGPQAQLTSVPFEVLREILCWVDENKEVTE